MSRPYRVCVVCSGNICRSPMAEVVLRDRVEAAGLGDAVEVDSAGTGSWHVGDGADPRALEALEEAGLDGTAHRARQFEDAWLGERDLVLVADSGHLRDLRSLGGEQEHVRLLREFDPEAGDDLDLADPWYGDRAGFTRCLEQIERSAPGVVDHVRRRLAERGAARP